MRRLRLVTFALLLGAALLGCKKKAEKPPSPSLAPLSGQPWLAELEVAGFGSAKLALPLGARRPRPLLIALHGDFDRPEWTCGSYRHAAGSSAFVLCPRGEPRGQERFGLGPVADTTRELRAALPALKTRFGAHVASGSVVLAALGPSVEHAIVTALQEPSFFARLVLVDGSLRRFDPAGATRYGQGGGRRVLVLCTFGGCEPDVETRVRALRPHGVDARLVRVEQARGLDSEAVKTLAAEWRWVVSGDTRW
jgi:hypothetical protein